LKIYFETNRLILQSLNTSHSEMYYDFLMRNAEFFKKWSPKYDNGYFDKGYHKKNLEGIENETREGRIVKFGVLLKNDPSRIISMVELSNIIKGPFLSCFLGYMTDEKENSRGYTTEAIKKVIDYGFNEIKLHRIEANIIPYNAASIRVVEKLGFCLEGYSRNYLQINGKWEDHLHYVMLNNSLAL